MTNTPRIKKEIKQSQRHTFTSASMAATRSIFWKLHLAFVHSTSKAFTSVLATLNSFQADTTQSFYDERHLCRCSHIFDLVSLACTDSYCSASAQHTANSKFCLCGFLCLWSNDLSNWSNVVWNCRWHHGASFNGANKLPLPPLSLESPLLLW